MNVIAAVGRGNPSFVAESGDCTLVRRRSCPHNSYDTASEKGEAAMPGA